MPSKIDKILAHIEVMNERDRNTAKDIEAIQGTLKIVVERSQKHDQSLYGEDGNNGLKGDMKSIKTRLKWLERVSYLGQGAIATFVAFKEKILG